MQEYPLADLRRQIALVGQQVLLFDGSVAGNVAYGELQALGPERIEAAVRETRDGALYQTEWKVRQRGTGERAEQIKKDTVLVTTRTPG